MFHLFHYAFLTNNINLQENIHDLKWHDNQQRDCTNTCISVKGDNGSLFEVSNIIRSKILTFLSWGKLLSFKNIAAANDDENISS